MKNMSQSKYDRNSIPDNNTTLHRLKTLQSIWVLNFFGGFSQAPWGRNIFQRSLASAGITAIMIGRSVAYGQAGSWCLSFSAGLNWTQSQASEVHSLPNFSNSAAHTKYYQKCKRNMTNAHLNLWFAMLLNPGKDITWQVNKASSRDHGIKCEEKIFHDSLELKTK